MKKPLKLQVKISLNTEKELIAYCDHLGISIDALVRKLIFRELVDQVELYKK